MHRAKKQNKKYGFLDLLADIIIIPVGIAFWAIEKAIDGCDRVLG